MLECLLVAGLTSGLVFFFSVSPIARCVDLPPTNHTKLFDPVTIFCPDGKFNDIATLFLVKQEDAIRALFHEEGSFSEGALNRF